MREAVFALRCMLLGVACGALACDECASKCDEDYQLCVADSTPEDCGTERARCESACDAEDASDWDGANWN